MADSTNREKKLSVKIISIVTSVLLALSVIFCVYVAVQAVQKKSVNLFGRTFYRVVSDSMEPTIPVGALIVTKSCSIDSIHAGPDGDIICFYSLDPSMRGAVITHRAVEVEIKNGQLTLHTMGDHNNSEDGYLVTEANFIGKVVRYTDRNSLVFAAMQLLTSKIGFFTCIGVPVLVIAAVIMKNSMKTMKEEIAKIKSASEDDDDDSDGDGEDNALQTEEEFKKALEEQIRKELRETLKNEQDGNKSPQSNE